MIYRVTRMFKTKERRAWGKYVLYCGDDPTVARCAYHKHEATVDDQLGGVTAAKTMLETLDDDGLADADMGVMVPVEVKA